MDDGEDIDVFHDGLTSKRACDSCRTRKIRCDKAVPCSNCRLSKITCTTTAPAQKAQRQRVHISEEYEKKIDRIEDRLAGIENVLESLATRLSNLDMSRDTDHSSQSRSNTGRGSAPLVETESSTFEGETAIKIQSSYAQNLITQAIGSSPSIGQNAEVKEALRALNELVTHQGHPNIAAGANQPSLINQSLADIDHAKLERPPWEAVNNVLDWASKFPTMTLATIFPYLKIRNLREIVDEAYQRPSQCTAMRRMLAYGVLHSIFSELSDMPRDDVNTQHSRLFVAQCKRHVEVAMTQLPMILPASYETIMSLMVGSACAIEMSKPSLSWVMISMAAGLCQNLGYHRIQTMKDDNEEERNSKVHICSMVYMFDRILSLRLGRASIFHDWDISLPYISWTPKSNPSQRDEMLSYWIKVARIQGQTYEKLFSPDAFSRLPEDRMQIAVELVNGMNQAWSERGEASVIDINQIKNPTMPARSGAPNETELPSRRGQIPPFTQNIAVPQKYLETNFNRIRDLFFYSDVVMHYSTCALIQRAVSPDNVTFDQDCLESSRAALLAHMRCNEQFNVKGNEQMWSGYVHWSILQAPFTPFIVIFCNVIQTANTSDLESLQAFIASLESCRTISEGADNLYKMCDLFCRIAKLYLQAKQQEFAAHTRDASQSQMANIYTTSDGTQLDVNDMTQFNPYLSALGLLPNVGWPMVENTDEFANLGMGHLAPTTGNIRDMNDPTLGIPRTQTGQSSVQDFFSGSRYLMNLMEAGDDLQMPDFTL